MINGNRLHLSIFLVFLLALMMVSLCYLKVDKAVVSADPPYSVSFTTSGGGTGSSTNPTGTVQYSSNTSVPITATAGNGYTFSTWTSTGPITIISPTSASTNAAINGSGTITAVFTQNTYTISTTVQPLAAAGSISRSSNGPYHYDDIVTLTESPSAGYTFSSWSGSGTGTGTTCTITVTGNMSVTATFVQNNYQVNFLSSPTGAGTTNPTGSQTYTYGQIVPISATSGNGYAFSSWSAVPSSSVSFGNQTSSATTVTINANATITANFVQSSYTISVSVAPSTSGNVSLSSNGPYHYGDVVTATANPAPGWSFSSWSGDGIGTGATRTITVTGNMAVTADFTQVTYQVTFATVGSGAINPNSNQVYTAGQQVSISATSTTGYSFSSWTAAPSNLVVFGNASLASTTATINGNATITATFTQNTYDITITTSGNGNVTRSSQGPYHYGDTVYFTANPGTGYIFSGWGGALSQTGSGNPAQLTFSANVTATANFTKSTYSVSVMIFPSSVAGSYAVNQSSPYHYGDVVAVTASPNSGYTFSGWSGDGSGTGNTRTVTVTGNMMVTAIFAQITYQVSFATNGGGSESTTTPSGIQPYTLGQVVPITANAYSGYTFSTWQTSGPITLDNASMPSTYATINGTGTITAVFTQNPTPTPTPTITPTPTSSPKQTLPPASPSPSPAATTSPTPTPNLNSTSETVDALMNDGSVTHLVIYGSLGGVDVSNATISTDQTASKTTVSLTLTGQDSANGLYNITIPKTAIKFGSTPTIYINNQAAENQGFSQDSNNYYLWFTTNSNNYELSITFTGQNSPQFWVAIIVATLAIILVAAIIASKMRSKS
jgi:uncharacterized repeat protein (TIGR02543 family)